MNADGANTGCQFPRPPLARVGGGALYVGSFETSETQRGGNAFRSPDSEAWRVVPARYRRETTPLPAFEGLRA